MQMASLGERLRDPVVWSDASQIVKTVAAAVIAWVIARDAISRARSRGMLDQVAKRAQPTVQHLLD